ncbi:MAG: hypothetical protein H7Y86_10615 [Rhizobacter sp.]|nr:hypothetical protein [Ferruginibacter sp.]
MLKSFIQSLLGLCVVVSLFSGCAENSGKQFSTKQDSLTFARAVMETYGPEQPDAVRYDTVPPVKGRNFQTDPDGGIQPIDWSTVLLYQSNYDKDPQIKSPQGIFYQGFSVDSAAYKAIITTASIKGLYLRLGKKPDGSYTIMILGLDANGNVMGGNKANKADGGPNDDTNWDNTFPCPENCPMEP